MRPHFADKELADLARAVVAINGWNRVAIRFRTVPGTYNPSLRAQMVAQVTGTAVAN